MIVKCYACGDPHKKIFKGKHVCNECYQELKYGKVKNQNISMFGGHRATKDDENPSQSNAIREMEDG